MWTFARLATVTILALLFLTLPIVLRDAVPDALFEMWDALVKPLRTPVNGFWWQYFNRYDQQPLFQLSSLLTQVAILTLMVEAVRWLWRRRTT
ncbi:hypothetical protein [Niveispirillum fermenti]|uniref:hypothetical protein n=1 Tax=Niveispirillum fermenti TaxID=1233113 RepID=UPI003A83927D